MPPVYIKTTYALDVEKYVNKNVKKTERWLFHKYLAYALLTVCPYFDKVVDVHGEEPVAPMRDSNSMTVKVPTTPLQEDEFEEIRQILIDNPEGEEWRRVLQYLASRSQKQGKAQKLELEDKTQKTQYAT